MTTRLNKSNAKDRDTKAIFGIGKDLSNVTSITLDGKAYTPAQLIALIQSDIDGADAADRLKATWQAAAKSARAVRTQARAVLAALKAYLIAVNGRGAAALLADFGFAPPKVHKAGAKAKAEAVDKTLATRKARHTMGPKQREQVKGAVATEAGSSGPAAAPPAPKPATPVNGPSTSQ